MKLNISNVGKILKTLNKFETIEFNTTLPIKLEVKEKISDIKYLVKLGKKEVITKSYTPLTPGKYFGSVKEFRGNIEISNLKPLSNIANIFEKIDIKSINLKDKEKIINHLANSQTKEEFIFFMNILLSLEKKVYHFIINENKKALLQYKFSKNRLKFYAVFNNLGEIEGEIYFNKINIYSPYKNTIEFIKKYSHLINLDVKCFLKDVKPIYEFNENLINLKA